MTLMASKKRSSSTGNKGVRFLLNSSTFTYLPPLISCGNTKRQVWVLLQRGLNPSAIAKELHIKRPTVTQHLKELANMGLAVHDCFTWKAVNNSSTGSENVPNSSSWGTTTHPAKTTRQEPNTPISCGDFYEKDRAHNIKVKYVVTAIDNDKFKDAWSVYPLKNHNHYLTRWGNIVVTYTGKSFIFQLPQIMAKDSGEALHKANIIALALKDKYESEINGLRLGEKEVDTQIITQHHAMVEEPFSAWCSKNGISFTDETLHIDASTSKPELEFINNKDSHVHFNRYKDFVKDIAENETPKMSDLSKLMHQNMTLFNMYLQMKVPKDDTPTNINKIERRDYVG